MRMMLKICLFVSCLYMALAATTMRPHHSTHKHHHTGVHNHHTGPTHEPVEYENFFFYYDYQSHMLLVRASRHKCYIYQTSAQEQVDVHSSHGLHTIEKNVIDIIDANSGMKSITHDDLAAMSAILGKKCTALNTIYQIN